MSEFLAFGKKRSALDSAHSAEGKDGYSLGRTGEIVGGEDLGNEKWFAWKNEN